MTDSRPDRATAAQIMIYQRTVRHLSQQAIADELGVSVKIVRKIEQPDKYPGDLQLTTVYNVAFGLGRHDGTKFLRAFGHRADGVRFVDDHPSVSAPFDRDRLDDVEQVVERIVSEYVGAMVADLKKLFATPNA